jgi:hypothetical protein
LFDALDADWSRVSATPIAIAAIHRWAEDEPALADLASPADAVRRCWSSRPPAAAAVLGALLRQAGDPLAARAVLQAVVPALRNQASRRVGGVRHLRTGQGWEGSDDFDADVVAVALARIDALAGTSPPWPAQAICEATWACLRVSAARSVRQPAPSEIEGEAERIEASPSRTDAETLALVVTTAVTGRWLAADDAQVIYATRVLGHTPAELAAAQGRDVRALRAQRARAERRLVHVGWAPPTRMASRTAALAGSA